MNLSEQHIRTIIALHAMELYQMLPPLCGRNADIDTLYFIRRADDSVLPEYRAMLFRSVALVEATINSGAWKSRATLEEDSDDREPSFPGECGETSKDKGDILAMESFLSDVPRCCAEFLKQAELAQEIGEMQDAYYRLGFVTACLQCVEQCDFEAYHRAFKRAIATAWGYIPYVDAVLEFLHDEDSENDEDDEDGIIGDAVFILGLIHGSLWFSFTDFPIDDLMKLLEKIPSVQ